MMEKFITDNISLNDLCDFHMEKFDKMPPQMQLDKVMEEWGEALNAMSLDEMLKECCDLILAIAGMFNAYDANLNAYMKECLIKVMNREYPDRFKHKIS